MARGLPSMTALLALLAMAGYQNRDKISEMLGGGQRAPGVGQDPSAGGMGGLGNILGGGGSQAGGLGGALGGGMGGLGSILGGLLGGGATGGGVVSGGLGELVDRFKQNGRGELADSWVASGPNKEASPTDLEHAIGPDVLEDLEAKTGLSRSELLARLSKELPSAIDKYTPDGRLPQAI